MGVIASSGTAFVTPDQIAARYQVPRSVILAWLRSGRLPHVRVNRKVVRIAMSDLERFETEQRDRHGAK
jgi:excisionase family DNA binding protein